MLKKIIIPVLIVISLTFSIISSYNNNKVLSQVQTSELSYVQCIVKDKTIVRCDNISHNKGE